MNASIPAPWRDAPGPLPGSSAFAGHHGKDDRGVSRRSLLAQTREPSEIGRSGPISPFQNLAVARAERKRDGLVCTIVVLILESNDVFSKSIFVVAVCAMALSVPVLAQGGGGGAGGGGSGAAAGSGTSGAGASTGGSAQGTGTTMGGAAEQPGTGQGVNPNVSAQTTGQAQSTNPAGQNQSVTGLPASNPTEVQAERNRGAAVAPNGQPIGSSGSGLGSPERPIDSNRH
jgi:hypothetical protein